MTLVLQGRSNSPTASYGTLVPYEATALEPIFEVGGQGVRALSRASRSARVPTSPKLAASYFFGSVWYILRDLPTAKGVGASFSIFLESGLSKGL